MTSPRMQKLSFTVDFETMFNDEIKQDWIQNNKRRTAVWNATYTSVISTASFKYNNWYKNKRWN